MNRPVYSYEDSYSFYQLLGVRRPTELLIVMVISPGTFRNTNALDMEGHRPFQEQGWLSQICCVLFAEDWHRDLRHNHGQQCGPKHDWCLVWGYHHLVSLLTSNYLRYESSNDSLSTAYLIAPCLLNIADKWLPKTQRQIGGEAQIQVQTMIWNFTFFRKTIRVKWKLTKHTLIIKSRICNSKIHYLTVLLMASWDNHILFVFDVTYLCFQLPAVLLRCP